MSRYRDGACALFLRHGVLTAFVTLAAASALGSVRPAAAASVIMISVDGMKPEYVTEADSHGLKIPFLRGLMGQGSYARGVTGVYPTITYPSHTTLLTGVAPAEHGILNNLEFDPEHHFAESWFWYADQIRAPTLWSAAHAAGLITASVGWPVSVGARGVDYLIPEYWRIYRPTAELNPTDRRLIGALSKPDGLLDDLQNDLGPYLMGNDTSIAGDEIKTRFAVALLQRKKPQFMTVHLSSLDDAEHDHGPFSSQANADLEAIDGMLSRLVAAARLNDPASVAVVVSDHGFTAVSHRVNLYVPFIEAGLMSATVDPLTKAQSITAWQAQPWLAGGMAAVVLREPRQATTEAKVRALLRTLQTDPSSGVAQVLEHDQLRGLGGFPDATFLVLLKEGYYTGTNLAGAVVTEIAGEHGGHGFSPEFASMRSAFFAAGAGVAAHHDLGIVDIRQIAPTVAELLRIRLPTAKLTALPTRQ